MALTCEDQDILNVKSSPIPSQNSPQIEDETDIHFNEKESTNKLNFNIGLDDKISKNTECLEPPASGCLDIKSCRDQSDVEQISLLSILDLTVSETDNPQQVKFQNERVINKQEMKIVKKGLQELNEHKSKENETNEENKQKEEAHMYCSTPVVKHEIYSQESHHDLNCETSKDFGQMSPLLTTCLKENRNLKRRHLGLECIEEVDEDTNLSVSVDKKAKLIELANENVLITDAIVTDKPSLHCFEPPAKSLLKKWQPSCLSRNSGSVYVVLDEVGECDSQDSKKTCSDVADPVVADDFEVACKSLTEELMKSSSNIETLEKYHSQVQLENQIDDEKFDEVLQEITLNYGWDEKTSLSLKTMEESVLNEVDKTLEENDLGKSENESSLQDTCESNKTVIELKSPSTLRNTTDKEFCDSSKLSKTIVCNDNGDTPNVTITVKVDGNAEISRKDEPDVPNSSSTGTAVASDKKTLPEQLSILYADGKDLTMDEEDFLLEEDISTKKKPYVFFEFVSSDPKENEDNYNPEWQKLGRLTSDEERYKAVRDRWRSLVPPDPNRDLTCRQWRERNHKSPLNLPSMNNNHPMHQDNERNQLCTAVFEMKIKRTVQELEDNRMNILRQRNMDFENLALAQDNEQRLLCRRGGSTMDVAMLHKHHIEECKMVKNQHDEQLKRITEITEEKIRILKEASKEVLLFQKFYKGVGAEDDEVCLYMTDVQVQELMETEEMLEQYTKFYK